MNKYQYYTDGKERIKRVIESCETVKQLTGARKYFTLFKSRVEEMFPRDDKLQPTIYADLTVMRDTIDRKRISILKR